jgi:hypothetical protein
MCWSIRGSGGGATCWSNRGSGGEAMRESNRTSLGRKNVRTQQTAVLFRKKARNRNRAGSVTEHNAFDGTYRLVKAHAVLTREWHCSTRVLRSQGPLAREHDGAATGHNNGKYPSAGTANRPP